MSLQSFNNGSPTYGGELQAMPFVNAAFQASRTLAEKNIDIRTNIKYKGVLQNFSASNVIDKSTCAYTDGFNLNVDEVIIEPKELQVNLTMCKQTLHDDWQSKMQMMSAHDNIPQSFEAYTLAYTAGLVGSELETLIYRGDEGSSTDALDRFDGIITRAVANTDVVDVSVTDSFASLTQSQAISSLEDIIENIPEAVYSHGPYNVPIYVGTKLFQLLIQSYGSGDNGIGNQKEMWWNGKFSGVSLHGHPVVYAPGLDSTTGSTTNYAFATYKENVVFGTGLLEDLVEAKVIDTSKTLGDRNVRIVMRFTGGTQIVNGSDFVLATYTA